MHAAEDGMAMPVDPHSHVPIYEQIVEHIRDSVAAGVYRPEESLPSIRELALRLVVNPNTVQRAYQELERQGLVYMRRGLGAFVAKDGGASAQSRSETAVCARFGQGVQIARAANMPDERIEAIFQKAMERAGRSGHEVGGAGTDAARDARQGS
jgi:GntR family transcriptional regulator